MIEIKPYIRKSLLAKLANVTYMGVTIPFDDENLTKSPAELPIGNAMGVQAWVLLRNQNVQDDSAKCSVAQNTQIQLDVITQFPNGDGQNTGNYAHADLISSEILQILFPYAPNLIDLHIEEAQIWGGNLVSSRHILEQHAEARIYRNILNLNIGVKQYNLST